MTQAPLTHLDTLALRRWAFRARAALMANRRRLDAINVFPVADADTGTNLAFTMSQALGALVHPVTADESLAVRTAAMARSTLTSARGNSGVILSQLVAGLADGVAESTARGADGIDGPGLASAFALASERARAAVARPMDGTILTVADGAAAGADTALERDQSLLSVVNGALFGARAALHATTAQLPTLDRAGVVDAGGAGLVIVLEALREVVAPTPDDPRPPVLAAGAAGLSDVADDRFLPDPAANGPHGCAAEADQSTFVGSPAYEVMYLLDGAADAALDELRDALLVSGDSLVIAGDETRRVHVHVDDAGLAIEAGLRAGLVRDISVSWLGSDAERRGAGQGGRQRGRQDGLQVRGYALGVPPGLAALVEAAGATVVSSLAGRTHQDDAIVLVLVDGVGEADRIDIPSPAHLLAGLAVADWQGTDLSAVAGAMRKAMSDVRATMLPEGTGEEVDVAGWVDGACRELGAGSAEFVTLIVRGPEDGRLGATGRGYPSDAQVAEAVARLSALAPHAQVACHRTRSSSGPLAVLGVE